MSSLAQEESRSISENVRWGQRKKAADGRYSLNYAHFLGYDKGKDGTLVVNAEQAKVVRRIYGEFLKGKSAFTIARELTEDRVPTPAGKKKWYYTTVRHILSNETYMGDKLLQKTYTIDFRSKNRLKNEGQVPQYYVEQDHEAIIPPETFRRVQDELERRKGCHATGGNIFSGRIYCGECGQIYGTKVWHSNDPYRKVVWQCNDKYGGGKKCNTPTLKEEEIKAAFERVLEKMKEDKAEIIKNLEEIVEAIEPGDLVAQKEKLERDRDSVASLTRDAASVNLWIAQDQDWYKDLAEEYDRMDAGVRKLEKKIAGIEAQRRRINEFIRDYRESAEEFTEDSWCTMVEKVTVFKERMIFLLTSGAEVEV